MLVSQGEGLSLVSVPFDHLVFCLGKVSNFSALPGVAEHALAMKDLSDAFRLRNHVLQRLELADIEADAAIKEARLTFVVAGGGFSGVETIGELQEMVSRSASHERCHAASSCASRSCSASSGPRSVCTFGVFLLRTHVALGVAVLMFN